MSPALRPCLTCGTPTTSTRCPQHTTTKGYTTSYWKTVRAQRLSLDNHRCTFTYPGCTRVATTVHLNPELRGNHLRATLDTTRSACRHCHGHEDAPRASGYRATSETVRGGHLGEARPAGNSPPTQRLKKSMGDFDGR